MSKIEEAQPLQELICYDTQQLVGWLYQWTSGKIAIMWQDDRVEKFSFGRRINDVHPCARANYWAYVNTHAEKHVIGVDEASEPLDSTRTICTSPSNAASR